MDRATIGRLDVDGMFRCWTLEDVVRPAGDAKVAGETAIPPGRYEVRITWSPRFQRELPLLLGVPGFEGVRIHAGNTVRDTEGCILVGEDVAHDGDAPVLLRSRLAFDVLFAKLSDVPPGEAIWLTIEQPA